MRSRSLLLLVLIPLHSVAAQRPLQSIVGIVRERGDSGPPIAGAEILLGARQTTSDPRGRFRLDSLAPGQYPIRVRHIGYRALDSRITVVAGQPTEVEFRMTSAPILLPTVEVEGKRTGIYGVVSDSAFRPLPGAKVAVLGFRGTEALTDTLGRFAFPNASEGTYLVQVTLPGYAERRLVLEIAKHMGRELSFRLMPESGQQELPGEAEALWELRGRLAFAFKNTRMTPGEIRRFGSMRLCDVPKLRALAGDPTTVILNGVTVLREVSLCSWRMDEIALLEFCSLVRCHNPDSPRPLRYPDPSGRRRPGGAIALWEKR